MNRRVELQTVVRVVDDDGGFTETWATAAGGPDGKIAAAFEPPSASNVERVIGGAVQAVFASVVRIRYHASATPKARLADGSRIYQIRGVRDVRDEHEFMEVAVEERV